MKRLSKRPEAGDFAVWHGSEGTLAVAQVTASSVRMKGVAIDYLVHIAHLDGKEIGYVAWSYLYEIEENT